MARLYLSMLYFRLMKILLLALGGALGTLCRHGVNSLHLTLGNTGFPLGTMTVNLIGSLLIGFLAGVFSHIHTPQSVKLFLVVGFLGGFTTFSSFSLDNFTLLQDGKMTLALSNMLISTLAGLILVFVGFRVARVFF